MKHKVLPKVKIWYIGFMWHGSFDFRRYIEDMVINHMKSMIEGCRKNRVLKTRRSCLFMAAALYLNTFELILPTSNFQQHYIEQLNDLSFNQTIRHCSHHKVIYAFLTRLYEDHCFTHELLSMHGWLKRNLITTTNKEGFCMP